MNWNFCEVGLSVFSRSLKYGSEQVSETDSAS